ncbi:hypothetical protein [Nocardia sp. XZ_19_369]|uniref:hypothetical protein n=1 Tax=Nocardia sp. XZ_19_369 TaxID=2769487 RepID=UPI00188FC9D9|nr:hypothetical protein [Nocardia sp. XZ_19_369]
MRVLRYADGTVVSESDLEAIARALGFSSAQRWNDYHAAAERRRLSRERNAA